MNDDISRREVDRLLLDAELHAAAAGIMHWLPQWFLNLNTAHGEETDRLLAAGDLATAEVFAQHGPVFEDGVTCSADTYSTYPCSKLRAVHHGEGIWVELIGHYDPDWLGEEHECGWDPADDIEGGGE